MSRFSRRGRLGVGLFVVLALTTTLAVIIAPPASATPPFAGQSFNPQDSLIGVDGVTAPLVLSDKFDGVDELAHLTSVATTDADRALYVVCPPGGFPVAPATAAVPPAGCTLIGSDTTGSLPTPGGPGFPPVDEAYEFFWDVPSTFDVATVGTRDVGVYSCTTVPTGAEPGGNCLLDVNTPVSLDDTATGLNSSSAEFVSWCIDGNLDGDCADVGIDSATAALGHGTSVRNLVAGQQYIVTARFAADVTVPADADLCIDAAAGAGIATEPLSACTTPIAATTYVASSPAFFTATYLVGLLAAPINSEMGWWLNEDATGSNVCAGVASCVLDAHYVVSTGRIVAQTHLTNDEVPTFAFTDEGPTFCQNANRQKNIAVATGALDQVLGCMFDQFSDPDGNGNKDTFGAFTLEPATFELSGPGATFGALPPDEFGVVTVGHCSALFGTVGFTGEDHDGDGLFEHCHLASAAADGTADFLYGADWASAVPGTVTVTFCRDPEAAAPADPNHGCVNATTAEVDTSTKTVVPGLDHLHIRQTADVAASPNCHVGDSSPNVKTRTRIDLTGCVRDRFGNATGIAVPVIWRLNTAAVTGAGPDPARFVGIPEQLTTDGNAEATVTASPAAAGALTRIFFCLDLNLDGVCDALTPTGNPGTTLFQIQWAEVPCIAGTSAGETLKGTRFNDCILGKGGNDRLLGKRGNDVLKGGPGDDVQLGNAGNDELDGGSGFDICRGGTGRDSFSRCEVVVG